MPIRIRRRSAERLADEDLMPLIVDGDAGAFEVFYDRHCDSAYSLAYRIVGERTAAEDAVQEAFVSIWRSVSRYDIGRGSVRSWTLGIVRNRAIDILRGRAGRVLRHALDESALEHRPSGDSTDEAALRGETRAEVRGALDALPGEQSRVIELAYFGGFSQTEIASMLDIPLGTVKGRMRLGLEKIRGQLVEGMA